MTRANARVSIIIVNWNGEGYLENCLASVFNQSYKDFKMIFVDNNSTDNSLSFVKDKFADVEIIALDKNYGFAKGNNIGIKYALEKYNPDYILLLNNDTKIVQEDALERLIRVAQDDRLSGVLGAKLINPDGKIQDLGAKISLLSPLGFSQIKSSSKNYLQPYAADVIMAAFFLIKRTLIDKIGLLDEGFSPFLGEDTDFCIRARKSGYLVKVVPAIEIMHYSGKSLKKQSFSYFSWATRKNNLRFMLLNFPLHLLIIRILFEFYFFLGHIFSSILERKNKGMGLTPFNLRFRKNRRKNLLSLFSAYLENIKNLKEILWKRNHRREKLWY